MNSPKKVVFFDRDGVINESPGRGRYVRSLAEFTFKRDALAMLATLFARGYRLVVITNQQGVGKGVVAVDELERIHKHMCAEAGRSGAIMDGVYYCPHLATDGCACRKPKPGLIYEAIDALDYDVDVGGSWFVGDSARDVKAGQAAGLRTIWVGRGAEREPPPYSPVPTNTVQKICSVAQAILCKSGGSLYRASSNCCQNS